MAELGVEPLELKVGDLGAEVGPLDLEAVVVYEVVVWSEVLGLGLLLVV